MLPIQGVDADADPDIQWRGSICRAVGCGAAAARAVAANARATRPYMVPKSVFLQLEGLSRGEEDVYPYKVGEISAISANPGTRIVTAYTYVSPYISRILVDNILCLNI